MLKKDYYEDAKLVLEWKYKMMQVLKTYRVLPDLMRFLFGITWGQLHRSSCH